MEDFPLLCRIDATNQSLLAVIREVKKDGFIWFCKKSVCVAQSGIALQLRRCGTPSRERGVLLFEK
jgi:hypothetical protein